MNQLCKKKSMRNNRERMISFGRIMRSLRIEKGITQQDLAHCMGVDSSKISNMENGLCENPGFFTISRICDALEVHPNVFFIEKNE